MAYTPVPYDPALEEGLSQFLALVETVPLRAHTIRANRDAVAAITPTMIEAVGDRPIDWEDRTIPGPPGEPDIVVTIVTPRGGPQPGAAGIYEIHGGGMILGSRMFGIETLIQSALKYGTVGVSIEYRLAPEHPYPAATEDCYAGLVWMSENASELGFNPDRLLVSGFSAGGGLTAAIGLMARDLGGPRIRALYLGAPMIDDRNNTVSSYQYDGVGAWDRNNNDTAWNALLPDSRATESVSPYAAPARATDLSNLPPAYIEVGAAEVFRDEAIGLAKKIWAAGGQAELHVWAGGYHGFQNTSAAPVAQAATEAKDSWIQRVLGF